MRPIVLAQLLSVCFALSFGETSLAASIAPTVTVAPPALTPDSTITPPGSLRYVRALSTFPARPVSTQPIVLAIIGDFPYPCGYVSLGALRDLEHIAITLSPRATCADTTHSGGTWYEAFNLGLLPAGVHRTEILLTVMRDPAAPAGTTMGVYRGVAEFTVAGPDTQPPPPPPPPPPITGPLPYVDAIKIGPKPNMLPLERPICPNDSIMVSLAGHLPNSCYSIRAIQLIPNPSMGPLPMPPFVRIVVDTTDCRPPVCLDVLVPWHRTVVFEPLPAQSYQLQVELASGACIDSIFPRPRYQTFVPFEVARCSTQVQTCVLGTFDHPNGPGECDATVSLEVPARVTFAVRASVPLSGLQGELRLDPPNLKITRLAPIGAATNMHLTWAPTPNGARFVLFAERGAPIPAAPWPGDHAAVPVLAVGVSQPPGARAPTVSLVQSGALLGSDASANAVYECQVPEPASLANPNAARICAGRQCDFNADGHVDVRDLVLMVHCLHGDGACHDSSLAIFDCNGDSTFTLDDVLCCARRILGAPRCPDCPPDSTPARPEPSIALAVGIPEIDDNTVRVPLSVAGAERIGAARLMVSFPAERFDVSSVELPSDQARADWLPVYEASGGQVTIGLIRLQSRVEFREPDPERLDLALRLALRPGQIAGGEIAATDADFSGPDGTRLVVPLGRPSQTIGGRTRMTLSGARPNPFSGETGFSLVLDRAADVSVGVYDVSGRLVASLHDGRLAPGTSEFHWNGATSGGPRATSGIYFYRATTRGVTVSRKLVMLGRN